MITPDSLPIDADTLCDEVVRFHININVTTTNRDPLMASVTFLARDKMGHEGSIHSLLGYAAVDCSASTLLCELLINTDSNHRTVDYGLVDRYAQIAALLNIIPDANLTAVITQLAVTFVGSNPLSFTREISTSGNGLPSCIKQSVLCLLNRLASYGPNERVIRALREGGAVHKHVSDNMLRYMSCLEN